MERKRTAFEIVKEAEERLREVAETEKQLRAKSEEAMEKLRLCEKLEKIIDDKRLIKIELIKFKKLIMKQIAAVREAEMAMQQSKRPVIRPRIVPITPTIDPKVIEELVKTINAAIEPIAQDLQQLGEAMKEYNIAEVTLRNQINEQYKNALEQIENGIIPEGMTVEQAKQAALMKFIDEIEKVDESRLDFLTKHDQLHEVLMSQGEALAQQFLDQANPPEITMDEQLKQAISELKVGIADHCITNNLEPIVETENYKLYKNGEQVEPGDIKVGDEIAIVLYEEGHESDLVINIPSVKEVSTAGDILVLNDDQYCFTNLNISHELEDRRNEIEIETHDIEIK